MSFTYYFCVQKGEWYKWTEALQTVHKNYVITFMRGDPAYSQQWSALDQQLKGLNPTFLSNQYSQSFGYTRYKGLNPKYLHVIKQRMKLLRKVLKFKIQEFCLSTLQKLLSLATQNLSITDKHIVQL